MNRKLCILVFMVSAIFAAPPLRAQKTISEMGYRGAYLEISAADTSLVLVLYPVFIFENGTAQQQYLRKVENIKKVYPLAKEARRMIGEMERHLATIPDRERQLEYAKKMQDALIEEYAPTVTRLTFQQGRILTKLIARELARTSYAIIRDMLGDDSAGIWQGIALIFGTNLKDGYDKTGVDEILEDIIIMCEHGVI